LARHGNPLLATAYHHEWLPVRVQGCRAFTEPDRVLTLRVSAPPWLAALARWSVKDPSILAPTGAPGQFQGKKVGITEIRVALLGTSQAVAGCVRADERMWPSST
jgi:hypothetical protein